MGGHWNKWRQRGAHAQADQIDSTPRLGVATGVGLYGGAATAECHSVSSLKHPAAVPPIGSAPSRSRFRPSSALSTRSDDATVAEREPQRHQAEATQPWFISDWQPRSEQSRLSSRLGESWPSGGSVSQSRLGDAHRPPPLADSECYASKSDSWSSSGAFGMRLSRPRGTGVVAGIRGQGRREDGRWFTSTPWPRSRPCHGQSTPRAWASGRRRSTHPNGSTVLDP